jgi:hypothetical protein
MRSMTAPRTWSGILFTKLQLFSCIFLLSHFSLENGHRLMNEENGKNREFWLKNHNVAANSWGKGENFHCFTVIMILFGMRPQHLILYDKRMVFQLGDGI